MRVPRWPWLIILLSCLNLAPGPAVPVLVETELPQVPLTATQVHQIDRLRQVPVLRAPSVLLADATTGQVLYSQDPTTPRPPASTTKIMTALLVLERNYLTETVRIPADLQMPGTTAGLVPGETLTIEELLYGLLLPSGNDAALALARYSGGTEEEFVAAMNTRAAELGLVHTHFVNPHGLDAPDHLSSAMDLLSLTRQALRHPTFARIVATATYSVRGHRWENRNRLLGQYPGADGIKTGTTAAAGECLIASATRQGQRLIAVVLGSQDRYAEATALLDYGFAHYTWQRLDLPPGDFRQVRGKDGPQLLLSLHDPQVIVLPRWQKSHLRSFLHLASVAQPGEPVGHLEFTLGGQRLCILPVYALSHEAAP